MTKHAATPLWRREFESLLTVTAEFVFVGNTKDIQLNLDTDKLVAKTLDETLTETLAQAGFDLVYSYDPLWGIELRSEKLPDTAAEFLDPSHLGKATSGTVGKLSDITKRGAANTLLRTALIVQDADQLWNSDASPSDVRSFLLAAKKLAADGTFFEGAELPEETLPFTLVFIARDRSSLPEWFTDSPFARVINIPLPTLAAREVAARALMNSSQGDAKLFAAASDGMMIRDLQIARSLVGDNVGDADRISEALRMIRLGVKESPWGDPSLVTRITDGENYLSERILGQSNAIRRSVDVLLRAALGLSGAQASGDRGSRPQGILFFAGPTGVGKTELAKSLAELVFGSTDAFTRFDMSEFSAEHSDARLIGAPPGYVGHSAGGELTNAVRNKPFSIVLFDEIEKAHPRILDKFLQILEDGRLTDGNGNTVHFSETVLVFTSNLGLRGQTAPHRGTPYEEHELLVRKEIERHFTEELQRPELLNRIGENIVVFDFIQAGVARNLVNRFISEVVHKLLSRRQLHVSVTDEVLNTVFEAALLRLEFGGRGVSSAVESAFINPLARALSQSPGAKKVNVTSLQQISGVWEMTITLP